MKLDPAHDPARWYVLRTKPKQEDRAISNLTAWKVESFTPKLEQIRVNSFTGELQRIIKPLFSCYVFARFSLSESIAKVRFTRGVRGVVTFGDSPTPVGHEVIDLLKGRMESDGYVRIREELKAGDQVKVEGGPLKNLKGVLTRHMKDRDRVLILLDTVAYQAHLELPTMLVSRLE
jgi:transcriptional antiterminator RfaH